MSGETNDAADRVGGPVIVRLYLPMEMGAVGRIMKAVSREFPAATIANEPGCFAIRERGADAAEPTYAEDEYNGRIPWARR